MRCTYPCAAVRPHVLVLFTVCAFAMQLVFEASLMGYPVQMLFSNIILLLVYTWNMHLIAYIIVQTSEMLLFSHES